MIKRALVLSLLLSIHAPSRAQERLDYRHLREGSLHYILFPDNPANRPWLRFNNPNVSPGEITKLAAFIDRHGKLDLRFTIRGAETRVRLWTRAREIVAKDGHFYLIYRPRKRAAYAREIIDLQLSYIDPKGLGPIALVSTLVAGAGFWTDQPLLAGAAASLATLVTSVRIFDGVNPLACRSQLVAKVPVPDENRPLFSSNPLEYTSAQ